MKEELKTAQTMAQILEICAKHYDLNEPLGFATKIVVTTGLQKVIKLINAKPINNGEKNF
jgi:hypothetical protein